MTNPPERSDIPLTRRRRRLTFVGVLLATHILAAVSGVILGRYFAEGPARFKAIEASRYLWRIVELETRHAGAAESVDSAERYLRRARQVREAYGTDFGEDLRRLSALVKLASAAEALGDPTRAESAARSATLQCRELGLKKCSFDEIRSRVVGVR